jgi:hypothetical protein
MTDSQGGIADKPLHPQAADLIRQYSNEFAESLIFQSKIPHSIGFSGRQRSLFCQGQLDPWFSGHTLSSTTQLSRK